MRKRITSALLALVMLLSLVPAMGTTASAVDAESHPTKVGLLGGTYEAYYIAEGGFAFAENNADSSEAKWNAYKARLGTKITEEDAGYMREKTIEGVAYYDKASGVLYITGNVYTCVSAVVTSTARDDVLKVVVDGNTNNDAGWCVTEVNHCLDKLNIEFRNNGTLTLRKRSGNSAVLGVIGYNGQPGSINWGTDPFWFGDLELSGTGKLKIKVSDDEQKLLCGIRARDISIKDNVSLDIKMGKSNASVMYRCNAAMICKSLTIDTTGTVQIDTALEDSSNRFSVFAPIANYYVNYNIYGDPVNSFNLVNAQSVTLKANAKNELFDTRFGFSGTQNNLGDRICEGLETNGWTVTKPDTDDAKPYTVTMTRAGLSDAALTVGSQEIPRTGAVTKGEIQADGGKQALNIKVKAPAWLTTLYNVDRVGYDYTAAVYENGTKLSNTFNLTIGGSSDGTSTLHLTFAGDFKPTAGKSYIVTFSVTPKVKATGEKLESAAISGNWLLTAVEKQEIVITNLSGNRSNISAGDTNPSIAFTAKAGDADVTLPAANVNQTWKNEDGTTLTGALEAGKIYTAEVKITAPNGYTFRGSNGSLPRVEVGNATKGVSGISCEGKTLYFTYTYQVPQGAHNHTLVTKYNAAYHWQECSGCGTVATSTRKAHELTDWENNDDETAQSRHCNGCNYSETRNIPGSELNAITNVVMDMKNYPVTGMRPHNFKHQDGDDEKYNEYILTYRDNSIVYPTFTLLSATGDVRMIAPKPEAYDFDTLADTADFASWSRINGATVVAVAPESKNNVGEETFQTGKSYQASIWLEAQTGYKFDSSFNSGNFTLLTDMDSAVITDYTVDAYYAVGSDELTRTSSGIPAGTNASKIRLKVSMTAKNMGTLEITLPEIKAGDSLNGKWATFVGAPVYGDGNFVSSCYGSDSMKWNDSLSKKVVGDDVTGDDITVVAGTTYTLTIPAAQENAIPQISIKNSEVATNVTKNTDGSITVTYTVAAETPESKFIPAAEVTVTAPALNAAPNTTATVPTDANYTVSAVAWTENPAAFEAGKSYKATVTVTPKDSYKFTASAIFSINGNTVTGTPDSTTGTVTLSYTFPALTAPHTHTYGTWTKQDDSYHSRTCIAGDDIQVEAHSWSSWTTVDGNTHKRTCNDCGAEQTASHNWVFHSQTDATFDAPGKTIYKCADNCGVANKEEPIAQLKKIDTAAVTVTAPVRGATPEWATTADSTYYVANTEWTPEVSSTFASGTVYTVKVELEAVDSNRFTDATQFTINGQTATVVGTIPADGAETVTLTYQFPATGTGSSSSGSGSGSTAYTVKVLDSKNGDVTSSHKTAAKGTTVTLTVSPDKGYTLDDLTVLDKNDKEIKFTEKNGKYTFTMPASNVEVEATFKAAKSGNPFVDVPSGAYYEDAVIWAVDKGVTSGTDATHFTPNGVCTRAQAVTFLWRAAGSPAPKSATMPFTDVAAGSYYEQAVLWAVENGITKGTSDTTFSPNATCSRAQIVTFLWRSQKSPAAGSVNPFTDVSADAYYADAVLWAVKESVTSGTTATTFSPNANCTRAQIVTFIYRALAE